MAPQRQRTPAEPMLLKDKHGRIVSLDKSNGISFDFSEFDESGHATIIRITNHKFDDWDEWRQEGKDLWRVYHKGQPDERVLRGNWRIDAEGEMHMVAPDLDEELPYVPPQVSAPPSISQDVWAGEANLSPAPHGVLIKRVFELLNQTDTTKNAKLKAAGVSAWMQRYQDSTALSIRKWSNPWGTIV